MLTTPVVARFDARRLRVRRQRLGLTIEVLARKIGVSKQALSLWETGVTEPRIVYLVRLAQALGDPVERFLVAGSSDRPSVEAAKAPPGASDGGGKAERPRRRPVGSRRSSGAQGAERKAKATV